MRKLICGIDEAGRGPIAGPVCAAAVVLCDDFPFEILADSKKLSPVKRERCEAIIKERALYWAVGWASRKEIDHINILQATLCAMKRAFGRIQAKTDEVFLVLVDGNKTIDIDVECRSIVRGDDTVAEIMAASILAKTARDRLMIQLDARYPQWGYAQHKGYPTRSHIEACRLFGPSPIQRHTFSY